MKISQFKSLVRESVKRKLSENQPAPSYPDRETITKPDTEEEKEKKRRRIGNPNVDPRPKNLSENEQAIIDKIIDRFKKSKK
jgi:hypothetical protein